MEQEEEPERPAAQTPMPPQEAGSMGIEEEDIEEEEEEELEAPSPVDVKACFVLPSEGGCWSSTARPRGSSGAMVSSEASLSLPWPRLRTWCLLMSMKREKASTPTRCPLPTYASTLLITNEIN